ncbi:hypothetical protein RI054_27g111390 [Pseudoscourfieldia marina]
MLYVIPVLVPIEAFTATMSELEQRLREHDDHARDAVILIRQRGIDVRESVAASLNVIAHVDDTSLPGINYACVWTMRKEGLPCSSRSPTRQLANSSIAGPVGLVELAKAVRGVRVVSMD